MRDGFRLFAKHPLHFSLMFVVFLVVFVLGAMAPGPVGLVVMALTPIFGLGFMLAAESALRGGPIHPGLFAAPLMTDMPRRKALLLLAAGYGLCMFTALALGHWADGGALFRLQQLQANRAPAAEIDALMRSSDLRTGVGLRVLLVALVSCAFWHAPALVHWGRQGAAQSLFSSVLAMWRNKSAFAVFVLCWVGIAVLFGTLTGVAMALLGLQAMAGLVVLPGMLIFSTVYFISMLFPFNDCFGNSPVEVPAP
jgi:hypothetical protein